MKLSNNKSLAEYAPIVGEDEIQAIASLADHVGGAKVVHVNATRFGGGVAEILQSLIPLANSAGVKAVWETIEGDPEFFGITKAIHNALQGDQEQQLSKTMFAHYLETSRKNAEDIDLDGEVIVIHDPQPLPLISARRGGKWVWRCHIDTSTPNKTVWEPLRDFVGKYDLSVFSLEKYIPNDLVKTRALVNHPCIDPLSTKNSILTPDEILSVLERFQISPDRPLIGQVARFDRWKDPLGAIDLYRKVKERVFDIQILLIGSFASDDPEGLEWHQRVVDYSGSDPDIHILTNRDGVGNIEVNAFQRSLTVALQLSLREGFGLTVSEALWKGVPVVARRAGGIPLQVIDGLTGFLIDNLDDAAQRVIQLTKMPWLARELGRNGAEHVKRNFLVTKRLKEYLRMHIELVGR